MKKVSIIAVGLVASLGFAACGDDLKNAVPKSTQQDEETSPSVTIPDVSGEATLPGGVTLPEGVSIPANIPGISGDCLKYVQAIASAFTGASEQSLADLGDAFAKLRESVPDELKDDVATLSAAFSKLGELYKKYNYDFVKISQDPEAQTLYSDPKFTQASDNLSKWLDTECQQAG